MLLFLFACTGSPVDSSTDSAAPAWPPPPGAYDCTAAAPPERIDPVALDCITDRACTTPLASGHRGMGGTLGVIAPEDTVQAVYAAIAWGLDFVETDPRPTADDALVNLHDSTVDRTTTGTGEASEMSLAEIQALPLRADAYPGDWGCAYIPTLQEILLAARGRVHVLVDANKTDRVDLLVGAIQETDTVEWAIFDTSSTDKIDAALALEPDLLTMIRVDDATQLAEQLAHYADHPPVIVEIDENGPELAADVLAAGHRPLSDVFFTDLLAIGDTGPSAYAAVYEAGIRIAQSDRPDLLISSLAR